MTTDEFGEVDIDLLADYIGGALDGPGQAEVARLIDQDPRWRETYDLLLPGMASVGAELTALGATPEPMPADLASRVEASFGSPIASPTTIDPALAEPSEPHLVPSSARHLTSVPATGVDRAARRRKGLRWAAPIAVAAGVLAFAGFSADYLNGQSADTQSGASSAGGSAEDSAPMMGTDSGALGGLIAPPTDDQITSSGRDYGGGEISARAAKATELDERDGSPAPPRIASGSGLAGLERLSLPDALRACLEAISREHGRGPIEVQSVDFARYQGTPAVVVRFQAGGASQVWAVGPECGADGGGADRL
jgi:hypothetical protein